MINKVASMSDARTLSLFGLIHRIDELICDAAERGKGEVYIPIDDERIAHHLAERKFNPVYSTGTTPPLITGLRKAYKERGFELLVDDRRFDQLGYLKLYGFRVMWWV